MKVNTDVIYCARAIYTDLSIASLPDWWDLCDLCERHGSALLIDPVLAERRGGRCVDGEVVVSPHCALRAYREIIPHELVHALAATPRWAWLNHHIEGWRYDRHQFVEAVAHLVGRMFAAQQSD